MDNEFEKKLDFDSNTFEDMKRDMTFVLQRLIGNMEEKGSNEGTMTLKIDITMIKEFIPNYDPDIKGETREVSKPQFKHKVTSAVKISDEKSGSLNNEMECIFDKETGTYVMVPIANTQQRSIFDADFQKRDEREENGDVIDGTAIEGGNIPALPGPQKEGDVIDGDFREVNEQKKCITGWSKYGVCSCCGNGGVKCCKDCQESCNSRCGWIDEPYIPEDQKKEENGEPGEGLEDITDELLGEDGEGDDGYSYDEPEDGPEE